MINRKGNGEIFHEMFEDGYSLSFSCPEMVLGDVMSELDSVKKSIHTMKVDLSKTFSKYSGRLF